MTAAARPFVVLWLGAFTRGTATYWIGRGVRAGGSRSRWADRLESPHVRRAEGWVRRFRAPAVTLGFLTVGVQTADGTLLRGEVLARWQEFVGTGEFFRAMEQKISWLRDRITAVIKGEPDGVGDLKVAVSSGLEALLRSEADAAAERADALDGVASRAALGHVLVAAVGPITAGPLVEAGITPLIPDRGRLGALVRAVVTHYGGADAVLIPTTVGRLGIR